MAEEKNSTSQVASRIATKSLKKKKVLKALLLIISYVIVGLLVWKMAEQWQMDPAKQQERAQKEIQKTVAKVNSLMILPTNETPQVATINNAEELSKTQDFFTGIQNGDQILMYVNARKAIIYRPSEHKIVNVGPIVAEDTKEPVQNQPAPKSSVTNTSTSTKAESSVKDEE